MVTLSRVSLEYNYDSERMQSEERFCQIEELDIRKDVDVFSATIGDEERMYALMKEKRNIKYDESLAALLHIMIIYPILNLNWTQIVLN
ncbi:hypothetical protein GTU79_22950 [Sodalis ligni]|uniref:hypothetical protein n=1 Tax=Sodalis ligni TaxID=2697027 RepID=UPI001BDEB0E1|nr:hypothetical protein [Sodalis ligni]QWA10089.1 hypothetical protein GTU79_22950 [Sodalis ligni]